MRFFSYRPSLYPSGSLFSISDLGPRGRMSCDCRSLSESGPHYPGGESMFLHWHPPI
ncbi:hypothetical protein Hanom_Chr12g01141151 [Helianthus anomalus]